VARAGKGKWEGKEVLRESVHKGIEACPGWSHVSVADSIQLFLFFASVHSAHYFSLLNVVVLPLSGNPIHPLCTSPPQAALPLAILPSSPPPPPDPSLRR